MTMPDTMTSSTKNGAVFEPFDDRRVNVRH
jgi:hypothetical protein